MSVDYWNRQHADADSERFARLIRQINNQIEHLEAQRRALEAERRYCRERIAYAEGQHQLLEELRLAVVERDAGQALLDEAIEVALTAGASITEVSRTTGIARTTLYRRHSPNAA